MLVHAHWMEVLKYGLVFVMISKIIVKKTLKKF